MFAVLFGVFEGKNKTHAMRHWLCVEGNSSVLLKQYALCNKKCLKNTHTACKL